MSAYHDTSLLHKMARQVRAIALCRPLLIAVDELNLYPVVFRDAFCTGIPRLKVQICRITLVPWSNIAIVLVIKSKQVEIWSIQRVIVQGAKTMIEHLLQTIQSGGMINTTFRQRLACQITTLQDSLYILGCVYNFCDFPHSLCLPLAVCRHSFRWMQRTPALAAGLADHRWTLDEPFHHKIPPCPWVKKQGHGIMPNRLKSGYNTMVLSPLFNAVLRFNGASKILINKKGA